MNGSGDVEDNNGGKLAGFYSYRNSFNEDNVWVEVPKRGMQNPAMDFK
jgi:hypothetical protein